MKPTLDMILSLPCDVQLPNTWLKGEGDRKAFVAVHEEPRRFRRCKFCASAALEYRQSFQSMRRPSTWHRIYTVNLARGGLSFLHSEQLFPQERAGIILLDGGDHDIEIVRCRRIQDRCFEIGARFVKVVGTAETPVSTTGQSR